MHELLVPAVRERTIAPKPTSPRATLDPMPDIRPTPGAFAISMPSRVVINFPNRVTFKIPFH
jgi:hypothetical protein